jgi:peptidoglycan/xylan/chitin deacetylase (PgdA/CDA1 family)
MNVRIIQLVCIVAFGLSSTAQANLKNKWSALVEYQQTITFLLANESENEAARQQNIHIARNFYYQKQQVIETSEIELLADTDAVNQLIQYISSLSHAADKLSFMDLIDTLLSEHQQAPFLNTAQLNHLQFIEQHQLLIQAQYAPHLDKIQQQLMRANTDIEPWQQYIDFLTTKFNINQIYADFNKKEAAILGEQSRGAGKKDLLWGVNIPEKTVVLTFDDGPHYKNTDKILNTLKEYNAKAYFFAIGKNIGKVKNGTIKLDKKSKKLQRALDEGHILANHSFSHSVMTKLSKAQQQLELANTNLLIKKISGKNVAEFRPPYGAKNQQLVDVAKSEGMRSIMWNIDSMDWATPVPQTIVDHVLKELEKKKKGIILFHDIHKQSVQALPLLMTKLKEKGYKVVTLEGNAFKQTTKVQAKTELYGESWALVVGINKYQYWPKLGYATNDAQGVKKMLKDKYNFKEDHIFTLLDEQATGENITSHISDILADPKRVKPNDRVFIFYAGHGMTRILPSGRNLGYIIPVDAKLDKFHSKSISMTHLQDFSDMIPAKHVYFVMDSCYSGIALTRSGGLTNYINDISGRTARQILTAGGAEQQVADGGPDGHSVFTWAFLKGLGGDADLDDNNIITASELGAYVSPLVSKNAKQTPMFGNMVGSQGGEFLFELAPRPLIDKELSISDLKQTIANLKRENQALKLKVANTSAQPISAEPKSTLITGISYKQRKSTADLIHRKALTLYKNKKYKAALVALEKALNYLPSSANIVNDYGFILFKDGQYQKAQSWLEKTIELDAKRTSVYLNIADNLVKLKREKEAIPYYQYYLELKPNSGLKERVDVFLDKNVKQ